MAEICCGVVSDSEASKAPCERSSRAARRRRMKIRRFKYVADVPRPETDDDGEKRRKVESRTASLPANYVVEHGEGSGTVSFGTSPGNEAPNIIQEVENGQTHDGIVIPTPINVDFGQNSKYGVSSVCGRRRDMEDAVTVRPSFLTEDPKSSGFHYYAVYDSHGCSHVAAKCRDRMHELIREELLKTPLPEEISAEHWKSAMERSFRRMDKEATPCHEKGIRASCRCEMQIPECDAVGSTAVVAIVTPTKIIVANCGDSRAVLCRGGKAVPLSTDHKPDRPDELSRIEASGGRVIYWDCARVLGVLAMSRSVGDDYLKPYVSCVPEVTITERSGEDECLVLASDGLWDVMTNETACGVARMCLNEKGRRKLERMIRGGAADLAAASAAEAEAVSGEFGGDKGCTDASMLLMKLALARHSSDNVSVVVVDLRKDT